MTSRQALALTPRRLEDRYHALMRSWARLEEAAGVADLRDPELGKRADARYVAAMRVVRALQRRGLACECGAVGTARCEWCADHKCDRCGELLDSRWEGADICDWCAALRG